MNIVRAELLRLRRWPAVWVTLGAWVALALMFGYLFDYLSYRTGGSTFADSDATRASLLPGLVVTGVPTVLVQGLPMFGGALMLVLGAMTAGNGYGWGTWKTLFTLGPSRTRSTLSTMIALAFFVVGTLAFTLMLDLGVSLLITLSEGQPVVWPGAGDLAQAFLVGCLVLLMWSLTGFALGTLARGPALSVGLGLVWALVVENLLRGVGALLGFVQTLTDLLPGTAAGSLVGALIGSSSPGNDTPGVLDALSGPRAAVTVCVYAVLMPVLTVLLVRRRDLAG